MLPVLANERPGNEFHWEGTNTQTDRHTDRHTDGHTDGHCDSMTESAQWADSVKT